MKVVIGSDHAGFEVKEELKKYLDELGYEVEDKGTNSEDSVDYPLYAEKVAKEVSKGNKQGVLICGTGLGMCMSANKVKGIRAALAYNESAAKLAKEHNNANVLCLGAREFSIDELKKIAKKFLESSFSKGERHQRRINEISQMEK